MLTRTDGDNHTVTYGYDGVERVTSVKLPSGATYGFSYDDLGNRTGVTMPNGKTHTYGFSPTSDHDLVHGARRGRDDAAATTTTTSASSITLPGRGTTTLARKTDGRLTGVGDAVFGYADATGRISAATRGARADTFAYDGALVTAAGEYTYGYGTDARLESVQLAGQSKLGLSYDDDGFVTGYGPFTWEREAPLSGVSKIADDALALALSYDGVGRQRGRTLTVKGAKRYENTLTRDDAGRITKRVETVGSTDQDLRLRVPPRRRAQERQGRRDRARGLHLRREWQPRPGARTATTTA